MENIKEGQIKNTTVEPLSKKVKPPSHLSDDEIAIELEHENLPIFRRQNLYKEQDKRVIFKSKLCHENI